MISVDGKQLVFTHPRSENLILRRDAVFAHRCPRCKGTRRASSGYIPSTRASIAAGVSWRCTAGRLGASEAGEDVEAAPGTALTLGLFPEPRGGVGGEVLLLRRVLGAAWRALDV